MDTRLIQDMVLLLDEHIAAETGIRLEYETKHLEETAALLHAYHIPYVRKTVILGCYYLLHLAIKRHRSLHMRSENRSAVPNRAILDGDYLLGLYFQFAVQMNETKLMSRLTYAYKKIQIALIHGSALEQALDELQEHLLEFAREEQTRTGGDHDEAA